jgi:hypothetical protein
LTATHLCVLGLHSNRGSAADKKRNDQLYAASLVLTAVVCLLLFAKAVVLRPKRFIASKANRVDVVCVPAALFCMVLFYDRPSPYRNFGAMIMSVRLLRLVLSIGVFRKLFVLLVGKECE